ncbi:MAG: TerB family tellurite resistance protein [Paracoccaceae bacterium]
MLSAFLNRLTSPAPGSESLSGRLALAALMVRLARADGDYAEAEIARIDATLTRRYGLSAFDAAALRQRAEALEADASDSVRFTRAIKEAVPHEDREEVLAALWQVVLADGRRDDEEDGLMRLLASLLGINDRDSALIRQRVSRAG